MKTCEDCGDSIDTRDGENKCAKCEAAAADGKRRAKAKAKRKAMHDALVSCGLVRVRGAMGGVYYE